MKPLTIMTGDALAMLKRLPSDSVHCCVTSPPYYGLRNYGVRGQMGLERTPWKFLDRMTRVFRELRRVLRADGTLWLNMGDSYAGSGRGPTGHNGIGNQERRQGFVGKPQKGQMASRSVSGRQNGSYSIPGLKPKDLMGMPWRLAFALQDDGWWLRQDIIWHKPNPMPEYVKLIERRCTTTMGLGL